MKFGPPKNVNYSAQVVRVRKLNPLVGCDNIIGAPLLGYQAIVSVDTQVGDLGVLFTAETQLSHDYVTTNNLYRHPELNADPTEKGYLDDNRRVRALKLRGHRSDALFMPLSSLAYLGIDTTALSEGDIFDEINGQEVCRKYLSPRQRSRSTLGVGQGRRRYEPRVDEVYFPRHFDTANYFRCAEAVFLSDYVIATQKLHGTSIRIGHTLVQRKLNWREKVARWFGVGVQDQMYAYVYGSRNVTKDPSNPDLPKDAYSSDLYALVGSRLEGLLPKGWVVYGEVIGWVPGTAEPIQTGYTYDLPQGVAELYVYRVAVVGPDGRSVDLSWPAVEAFCGSIGAKTVPKLADGMLVTPDVVATALDVRLADTCPGAVPTAPGQVDEGVCLRIEGLTPLILKAKSPAFLRHETKMLDKNTPDMEEDA